LTRTGDDSFNLWETMEEEEQQERHFIGFDFSTQQIKAVVVNSGLEVTAETHVHFDSMLPEYKRQLWQPWDVL